MTLIAADGELHGRALGAIKQRLLLELLVAQRGSPLSKDELIDALWSRTGKLPDDPGRTLEHHVSVLRSLLTTDRAFGRTVLVSRSGSYLLEPELLDVDEDRFRRMLRHAANVSAHERRPLLDAAVALGHGELFADSARPEWSALHRSAHREAISAAHQTLAGDALQSGELHRTVWHAEQALRFTPADELPYQLLMVAHVGLGDRDLAKVVHRRCATAMQQHLGLSPTARTLALARSVDDGVDAGELAGLLVTAA